MRIQYASQLLPLARESNDALLGILTRANFEGGPVKEYLDTNRDVVALLGALLPNTTLEEARSLVLQNPHLEPSQRHALLRSLNVYEKMANQPPDDRPKSILPDMICAYSGEATKMVSWPNPSGGLSCFDTDSGETLYRYPRIEAKAIVFFPDGKRFVVGGDREIIIYDASDGKEVTGRNVTSPVTSLAVSPGNDTVVVGSWQGQVTAYKAIDLQKLNNTKVGGAEVDRVEYLPSGEGLIAGSIDGTVSILRPDLTEESPLLSTVDPEVGAIKNEFAIAPRDERVAVAQTALDVEPRLYVFEKGSWKDALFDLLVSVVHGLTFAPNGRVLGVLGGQFANEVYLVDLKKPESPATPGVEVPCPATFLKFDSQGGSVLIGMTIGQCIGASVPPGWI